MKAQRSPRRHLQNSSSKTNPASHDGLPQENYHHWAAEGEAHRQYPSDPCGHAFSVSDSQTLSIPSTHYQDTITTRSPSMHQMEGREEHDDHSTRQLQNTKKKAIHHNKASSLRRAGKLTGSNASLHSTSSEEPAAAYQRRGSKVRIEPQKKKIPSGLARESVGPRRNTLRKRDANNTDSDSDMKHHSSRNKVSFASANSVARAGRMKPGVIKHPVADSRRRGVTTQRISPNSPDLSASPHPASPPVPAVARKMATQQHGGRETVHHQPPPPDPPRRHPSYPPSSGPAGNSHQRRNSDYHYYTSLEQHEEEARGVMGYKMRSISPPVPAVAHSVTETSPQGQELQHQTSPHNDQATHRPAPSTSSQHSSPLSTSAVVELPPLPSHPHTHQHPAVTRTRDPVSIRLPSLSSQENAPRETRDSPQVRLIARPPSCSPEDQMSSSMDDVSWSRNGVCTLPPLVEVSSSQEMMVRIQSMSVLHM